MTDPARLWDLDRFPERFTMWRDLERPEPAVAAVVEEWIPTRKLDPRRGARLEREEDNFYFAQIPGTACGGAIVVCSYWIVEADHLVRCDLFGTLSLPV